MNSARYYHKRAYVFMQITRYSCQNLTKLELAEFFFFFFFEKYTNSNFTKILTVGAELSHADSRVDGQMDRQTKNQVVAFTQFCEKAPKIDV